MDHHLSDESPVFHKHYSLGKADGIGFNHTATDKIPPAIALIQLGFFHYSLMTAHHPYSTISITPIPFCTIVKALIPFCHGILRHLLMPGLNHVGIITLSYIHKPTETTANQHIVGIHKGYILTTGTLNGSIARHGHTTVFLVYQHKIGMGNSITCH